MFFANESGKLLKLSKLLNTESKWTYFFWIDITSFRMFTKVFRKETSGCMPLFKKVLDKNRKVSNNRSGQLHLPSSKAFARSKAFGMKRRTRHNTKEPIKKLLNSRRTISWPRTLKPNYFKPIQLSLPCQLSNVMSLSTSKIFVL
jgi:hypothetical protein